MKVLHADSLDSDLFKDSFVDLTVTSPPYNVGIVYHSSNDDKEYQDYLDFTEKWLTNLYRWTKETGRLCLNIPLDKNKGGQKSVGADITTIAQRAGFSSFDDYLERAEYIKKDSVGKLAFCFCSLCYCSC